MAVPFQQAAFILGEVAPSLFGRQDLARAKLGASTARNMFARYSGGLYSRAGTSFVGFSKQTGSGNPPRLIKFQFSQKQGLVLEFGNQYMRVIQNGAYVTESPIPILNITQASPAVLTVSTTGGTAATTNLGGVTATYKPGDNVTLAGGTFTSPMVVNVTNTELLSTTVLQAGSGYVPADTIHLTGGVQSVAAVVTVATTKVVSATVAAGGAGGTDGQQTVTGTTGTGTFFTALVQVTGGAIASVIAISSGGSYTVNPTVLANEPVTGGGVAGGQLSVKMGVRTVTASTPGTFTTNPTNNAFTQASTSGSGTGVTFGSSVLGPRTVSVVTAGAYSVFPSNPVSQASTTGTGVGVTFTVTTGAVPAYNAGDWVSVSGVQGMTPVNNQIFVIGSTTSTTITLFDVYGNAIDSTLYPGYAGGGVVARIYTAVSPYSDGDLEWLKFTQSADVMSICCVNQDTGGTYPPYDLTRHSDTNWTFDVVSPGEAIAAPVVLSVTYSSNGNSTYSFIVTAIAADGSESLGGRGDVLGAVDIYASPGTISVNWTPVPGAISYNVYQASVNFTGLVPDGSPFGIVATGVTATSWNNTNIPPDYTQVPPTHQNPFPDSNHYPGVVSYFQERRMYANSLLFPDTYFMSQPGSFKNFDQRTPPIDSDAIIGTPWSVQVDGIQFIVDMPGGAVVLTGQQAWQLTGQGGSSFNPQPITPATQQAQPQAFNGCHNHIGPIRIDYDILYVQSKGSIVRDLNYNFYSNIYTGQDITLNSSHLFNLYQLQEWAWAEEPYKLLWAVRTDGALLSCTFLKPEQITAWTRHDTQGAYCSVASVTEPPVDAVYVAVRRTIGSNTSCYMIERFDDRLWSGIDSIWCVDAGRSYTKTVPNARLTISSANGAGQIGAATVTNGGTGYSSLTQIVVTDNNGQGPGTGGRITPTIIGGAIAALTITAPGQNYVNPQFTAVDPAGSEGGSGFSGTCTLINTVTFSTDSPVFGPGSIGQVIRAAGGMATITAVASDVRATGNVQIPFTGVIPALNQSVVTTNTEGFSPVPAGNWAVSQPTTVVTGLAYLAGASVVGVADGQPFGPVTVSSSGTITLASPASNIVVGLSFLPQFQSLYLDSGQSPTVQGRRKKAAAATLRVESSRGFQAGVNQVDGSTLSPPVIGPVWSNLTSVPDLGVAPFSAPGYVPMATGDVRVALPGGYNTRAQVAAQQPFPLPLNIMSIITETDEGDVPEVHAPKPRQRGMVQQQPAEEQ